jgi:hypothetical protein
MIQCIIFTTYQLCPFLFVVLVGVPGELQQHVLLDKHVHGVSPRHICLQQTAVSTLDSMCASHLCIENFFAIQFCPIVSDHSGAFAPA